MTTSLNYLIVAFSILLQPFTVHTLNLAGAEPIKPHVTVESRSGRQSFRFCLIENARLLPNEMEYARRVEQRNESVQLRDLYDSERVAQNSSTILGLAVPGMRSAPI